MTTFGGDTKKAKKAQLIASAIIVVCPHCQAIQPAPDNVSVVWESWHVDLALGKTRQCTSESCKQPYYLPTAVASVRMP